MKKGPLNIIMTVAIFAIVTGCSTVPAEHLRESHGTPILSAAQIDSMIRVEIRELEPIVVEDTVRAAASFERR